ncbi:hypothetical protein CANTEDRAFT_123060 [Yamadazyma tenuis ATCC 10573]|uniref:Glycerophosphocholine acyltransferase 1 n=3 Tax=Candida tenuis TaxID=2315449 RepID=G3B5B0_CANTC|nr:uncharacterized protein CANTEDRAFT_123060 [Yamadazyma tenuis ATCC 10573]EGV63171.1 hypothetical protein CANTEDRAFT_123060 [Yamadazyma tenuis ATCC 10573]
MDSVIDDSPSGSNGEEKADFSSSRNNDDYDSETELGDYTLKRTDSSSSLSFIDLNKLLYLQDFDFGVGLDHVSDSAKRRFNEMKTKTKQRLNRLKIDSNQTRDLSKLQELLNQRLAKFDEKVHKNLESSATEKLFYALAVSCIAAGGFVLGKYPSYFHVFYTVLFCLLMPIRFYSYFKQSFQYYLADLCYYVNLLLMLFIWYKPDSKSLFVSVFSLSLGTLSFAVITWRNSLVLHSIEKTTSSFIHVMPPITLFVIVHEMPKDFVKERFPAVLKIDNWNFVNGIIITSIYYTVWQVGYHYFITIRKKKEIENGRVTSFTYLRKKNKATVLGRFVNSLPYNWMQITAFTFIQFFYQIFTMIPCPLWFKYKHFCGSFVAFVFIWSSYNGATYYIDVFGKRFEKEVKKLKQEINDLQARVDSAQASPEMKPQGSSLSSTNDGEFSKEDNAVMIDKTSGDSFTSGSHVKSFSLENSI